MTRPLSHKKAIDPDVTVIAWSGTLTALAARLRLHPNDLVVMLNRNARRAGSGYTMDVRSDAIMARVRCSLLRGPGDE